MTPEQALAAAAVVVAKPPPPVTVPSIHEPWDGSRVRYGDHANADNRIGPLTTMGWFALFCLGLFVMGCLSHCS